MAISEKDFIKEKRILNKVNCLVSNTINDLSSSVSKDYEDLREFKKVVWSDSHSFDSGDIEQVRSITQGEESRALQKQEYYKRLKS